MIQKEWRNDFYVFPPLSHFILTTWYWGLPQSYVIMGNKVTRTSNKLFLVRWPGKGAPGERVREGDLYILWIKPRVLNSSLSAHAGGRVKAEGQRPWKAMQRKWKKTRNLNLKINYPKEKPYPEFNRTYSQYKIQNVWIQLKKKKSTDKQRTREIWQLTGK